MKLPAWRKEHGKTQRAAAAELAVHRVTLNRYETGAKMPPPAFVERCRDYTGGAVEANDWAEAWAARHRGPSPAAPADRAAA